MQYKNSTKILFVLFLVGPIQAVGGFGCPDQNSVKKAIYNCGANKDAALVAEACARNILNEVRAQGVLMQRQMKDLEVSIKLNQKISTIEAIGRLDMGMAALLQAIIKLQKNTSLIASYSDVMIDRPGSKKRDTSYSCFNSAFDKLQNIVGQLDDEIINSKNVYAAAEALAAKLDADEGKYSSITDEKNLQLKSSSQNGEGPKAKKIGPSGISGLEDLEIKK